MTVLLAASEEDPTSCPLYIGAERESCCASLGFDVAKLSCDTCQKLEQRLEQVNVDGKRILNDCLGCCMNMVSDLQRFDVAWLSADASTQDQNQDLHDFIKRKAPLFPGLEVEYVEGAAGALEFENEDNPDYVLRADVASWKSDHIAEFLTQRLKSNKTNASDTVEVAKGAWTAEIQTCQG